MTTLRWLAGAAVLVTGVVLVFLPDQVGAALNRPATTSGEAINLRATWGGTLAGLGAFAIARDTLRPYGVTLATLLLCTMASIGLARLVGFALDGGADALQWTWLVAEAAIVLGAAWYLRRRRRLIGAES